MLGYIDRFGARAVTGSDVLPARQIRRMMFCENVVKAYNERANAINWATWAIDNADKANLLNECEAIANGRS